MKWLKVAGVVCGAVVITALGIDAADTLSGNSGTMLGQLIGSDNGVCPAGMVEVSAANSFSCVDRFEASSSEDCRYANPANQLESAENLNGQLCAAATQSDSEPWRNVTREQAAAACARAGKRLPSASEWYQAALGTVDDATNCNTDGRAAELTGNNAACVSAAGAEDMIGNVWEWVSDDVIDGQYNARSLPDEGYVVQVDGAGVPTVTENRAEPLFNDDYFWSAQEGAYGMLRGGFYGSESDAGIYTVHAETLPTTAGVAIGFRCVQ